jgi:hypothetical protein
LAHLLQNTFGSSVKFDLVSGFLAGAVETKSWPCEHVVGFIKYYCIAPYAKFFKNGLPDPPRGFDPAIHSSYRIFKGQLGRWFQHRIKQVRSSFFQKFFYSFYQTKRGCAPMDDKDVLGTYEKHKKALSRVAEPLPEAVLDCITKKAHQVFKYLRIPIPEMVDFELSHNASFEKARREGGTWQTVMEKMLFYDVCSGPNPQSLSNYITPIPFVGQLELDFQFRKLLGSDAGQIVWSYLGPPVDFCYHAHEQLGTLTSYFVEKFDRQGLVTSQDEVEGFTHLPYRLLLGLAHCDFNQSVEIAPIYEPLKVRLVSKGNGVTYSASMPVQKGMHSYLRHRPQFALIGEPLSVVHFDWLSKHPTSQMLFSDPDDPGFWNSGDYSAATDGLHIGATKAVMEVVLKRLSGSDSEVLALAEVCRHVLYEQDIHYPRTGGVRTASFAQTCGQLMGSTLSFPILCVVNLMTYWLALEEYFLEKANERGFMVTTLARLKDLAVLINGDDILFACNNRLHRLWKKWAALFGLDLSPGKSLTHPFLATINSQQWRFRPSGNTLSLGAWEFVPYFPVGLLIEGGSAKVSVAHNGGEAEVHDLSSVWNTVCPAAFDQSLALASFLRLHKAEINRQTSQGLLNMFACRQAGGLGFMLPKTGKQWTNKYTRFQRALCHMRHTKFLGKVCKKPSVARVGLDIVYKNVDLNDRHGFFVAVKKVQDELLLWEDVSFQLFEKDPKLVIPNSSSERFFSFRECPVEFKKEFNRPHLGEIFNVMKKRKEWRDRDLATEREMTEEFDYLEIRYLPVA